jgi:hypothetical protein
MQYKINEAIRIRYLAISLEEGLTDLKLVVTKPDGSDLSPVTLTELGDGLYETTFTPTVTGWYWVRINSVLKPRNVYSKSYFIEQEYQKTDYDNFLLTKSYGTAIFQEDFRDTDIYESKWEETIAGSASRLIQNQALYLKVTTASGDSIAEHAVDSYSYIVGVPRKFHAMLNYGILQINNTKTWGVCSDDDTNCYEFALIDGVLKFEVKKSGVETLHDLSAYQPAINTYHRYDILFMGTMICKVFIDNILVLNLYSSSLLLDSKVLRPRFENYNTALLAETTGDLILQGTALYDESGTQKLITGVDNIGLVRPVSVTQLGRLEVENIPSNYITQSLSEVVDTIIPVTTDHWILNLSNTIGIIEEFHIITDHSLFLFKINVDGINYFDESGANLDAQYFLTPATLTKNIGTNASGTQIHWTLPIYFNDSIQIGIYHPTLATRKLKAYIILYKIRA